MRPNVGFAPMMQPFKDKWPVYPEEEMSEVYGECSMDYQEGSVGESCKSLVNDFSDDGVDTIGTLPSMKVQSLCSTPPASNLPKSGTDPNAAQANSQHVYHNVEYNPLTPGHTHGTTCLAIISQAGGIYMACDGCSWGKKNELYTDKADKIYKLGNRIHATGAGPAGKYVSIIQKLIDLIKDDVTFNAKKCAKFAHYILKWGRQLRSAGLTYAQIARMSKADLEKLGLEPRSEKLEDECSMVFAGRQHGGYRLFVCTKHEVKKVFDANISGRKFVGSFHDHYSIVNNFVSIGSGSDFAALEFLKQISENQANTNVMPKEQCHLLVLRLMQAAADGDRFTGGVIKVFHVGNISDSTVSKFHVDISPLHISKLVRDQYGMLCEDASQRGDSKSKRTYGRLKYFYEQEYESLVLKVLREKNRMRRRTQRRNALKAIVVVLKHVMPLNLLRRKMKVKLKRTIKTLTKSSFNI